MSRCDWRLFLSFYDRNGSSFFILFYDRNGGNYNRMNGAGKGKSCSGEGGLFLLLLFAVKKFEEHFYQLGKI